MKKLISLVLALMLVLSMAAFAEEIDTSGMTSAEWYTYEWHKDVADVYTNALFYDYDYLRNTLVPLHEKGFAECVTGVSNLPEEERLALVQQIHDNRINAPMTGDPEAARIYLWPEGKMPTVTEYTENPGYFFGDAPSFVPFMYEVLVPEDVTPKGAILICAGGGFNCRCNIEEGVDVARAFNELGYQCFIVNYRLSPYTTAENGLDLARAVRIVRANAEKYRIDPDNIAAAGFSAGGFVVSTAANNYYGDINASVLVESYVPDEIDAVSADINAVLCIYSHLPTEYVNPAFPASFMAVGSADGMFSGVIGSANNAMENGVTVELHTFSDAPHGFGAGTTAAGVTYENAATWPALADAFMTSVYAK